MKLMVYGTLKRGYGNNRLLAGAEFVGEAMSIKPFVLHQAGFPIASPVAHNGEPLLPIKGEVYEVDHDTLAWCDRLEGHPNWYKRVNIQATLLDTGEVVDTMIYEQVNYTSQHLCRIVNGEYYLWER